MRGGRLDIYDEAGEDPRIRLGLLPETGSPVVLVRFGDKAGLLVPNTTYKQ